MLSPLRLSLLATAATAAVLAYAGNGLIRADGGIERRIGEALEQLDRARVAAPGGIDRTHLHLSRLPDAGAVAPGLAVGDRITLAQLQYQVTDVRLLAGNGAEAGQARLLLVVAVGVAPAPARTIRFIIDAETEQPAARETLQPL